MDMDVGMAAEMHKTRKIIQLPDRTDEKKTKKTGEAVPVLSRDPAIDKDLRSTWPVAVLQLLGIGSRLSGTARISGGRAPATARVSVSSLRKAA